MKLRFRLSVFQVQCMIPFAALLIRCVGIQNSINYLCKQHKFNESRQNNNLSAAKGLVKVLKTAVEGTFWKGNCLSRSVVLKRLLHKHGIDSELIIGVRKKAKFKAHAWVEHRGTPLNAGPKIRTKYQAVEDLNLVNRNGFS